MSSSISKTDAQTIQALTQSAGLSNTISSTFAATNTLAATVGIHFGRRIATAGGAGVTFRIEGNMKASGAGFWFPLAQFTTQFAATTYTATGGSGNTSGTPTLTLTNTGFVVGDIVHIDDGTSTVTGEFHRVVALISTTGLTLEENLNATHNSKNVSRAAEMFVAQLDLTGIKNLRVVADAGSFTQVFAWEAWAVTGDSIV
jgi:hypothetical protein